MDKLKTPEAAIRQLLIDDEETEALIGDRIFPIIAPMSAKYPFVVYRRTSLQRESTVNGPMGTPTVSIDFSCLSDTYETARTAADAVRKVVDQYAGFVGGVFLQQCYVDNESDDFVQLQGTEMPPSYSVTLSLSVLWMETER